MPSVLQPATVIATIMQIAEYSLLLIAGRFGDTQPKLYSIDWLDENQSWHSAKSIVALKKHLNIYDLNSREKIDDSEECLIFIDKNSLNKNNSIHALLINAISQLDDYQSGKRKYFDLALDLSMGTPFQQAVWIALHKIEYGKTISYAQLAAAIGKPSAYRAVANANGKNPFSIVIPCHRVIASDGGLGGYTGGLDKKKLLLQIEKEIT